MATSIVKNIVAAATIKAFEDKIAAHVQEGKSQLEQFEAKTREKVADLKTKHEGDVANASAEIEADVAKLKTSVDELGGRLKNYSAKH